MTIELNEKEMMILYRAIRDRMTDLEKILKLVEDSEFLKKQYTEDYETLNNILHNKL